MGRPVTVVVGPLASSSATKVSLSQKAAISGTNYLVLNGAAGSFTANSVCASQTPGGAGALTLNGTLASSATGTTVVPLPAPSRIYITTAADESAKTFVVVGRAYAVGGGTYSVTETITGASTSTVSSIYQYSQINSITASGATSGAITVGHYGTATLDVARQILITNGGNDTGITFTISGTDWYGEPISEAVTGASGATAVTTLDYKTITSIATSGAVATTVTVGTNGVAHSPWVRFDDDAALSQVGYQCNVSGTVSYTSQATFDDPNSMGRNIAASALTWVNTADTNLVNATTAQQSSFGYAPLFARIQLNSGTGTVTSTYRQAYLG